MNDDEKAVAEIERLVLEGINSGEPFEVGPEFWEDKHRRLDERLKENSRE